jgi:hypothetical protein
MRKLIPPIAGTLITVAFELSVDAGWFKSVPDTIIATFWFVPVCLWLYWGYMHEGVRKRAHLLHSSPMISLLAFVLCGGALGASAGALGWWSLKKEHERRAPSGNFVGPENAKLSEVGTLLGDVSDATYRDLVADVIHRIDPASHVSKDAVFNTPDGTRTVSIEVNSADKKLRAIVNVVDLQSARPVGIELVDAADSQRKDFNADVMLICSNTGFEQAATSKARRKNIGLISVLHQGDKSIKAVITEEIYIREIVLGQLHLNFGQELPIVPFQLGSLLYHGRPVFLWIEKRAALDAASQQKTRKRHLQFNFIRQTDFDVLDPEGQRRKLRLRSISVTFTPSVTWSRQTIQLDAPAAIYDWVRGRLELGPGTNSFTVNGLNLNAGIPMSSPPLIGNRSGLKVGDVDFLLSDVKVDMRSDSEVPDMDGLIRPEDLVLKLGS